MNLKTLEHVSWGGESKLLTIAFGWLAFLVGTLIYCFCFALLFHEGTALERFNGALECVAKDWLIWVCLTPVLWQKLRSIDDWTDMQSNAKTVLPILLSLVLVAALTRLSLELFLDGESILWVLMIYIPRYTIIALIVLGCLAYLLYADRKKDTPTYASTFSVCKGQEKVLLPCTDILSVKSDGNYLEMQTHEHTYLYRQTLKGFIDAVDPSEFIRVHRSFVVRQHAIESVNLPNKEVILTNGARVKVGRNYQCCLDSFR